MLDKEDKVFGEYLIADFFYQMLNQNEVSVFESNMEYLNKNIHSGFIITPLFQYYKNLRSVLANPEIATNSILKKMENTSGKSILDSILSQNRGKVIYIDCWATWCGPCLAEMPNSEKLMQQLKGQNIEFVFLCLDSKRESWELKVSQLQFKGEQIFCNPEQSRDIRKGFDIEGIPFYILIDRNGNINESGNYLGPGNPETQKKIENLLKRK